MDISKFALGGKPVYAANKLREEFQKKDWDSSGFWGLANSYRVYAGAKPAVGHVIMLRKDVESLLSLNRPYQSLMIGRGEKVCYFSNVVIESACNLGNMIAEDPGAPMLVRLTDWKYYARQAVVNRQFNVRSWRDAMGDYFSENDAVAADWEAILDYLKGLWDDQTETGIAAAVANLTLPAAPSSPPDGPENMRYVGMSAWDALCDFYARQRCVLVYDPTLNGLTLTAARAGKFDSGSTFLRNFRDLIAANRATLVSHSNPANNYFAKLPEKLQIYFKKAWEQAREVVDVTSPLYGVEYLQSDYTSQITEPDPANPVGYSFATGTVEILKDETLEAVMEHYMTHSDDPFNLTELEARAEYLGLCWYYHNDSRNLLRRIYGDVLKFTPCEVVSEVAWYDLGDGPRTEVICRIPELPTIPDVRPKVFDLLEGFLTADMDPSTDNGNIETTATMSVRGGKGADWTDSAFSITLTNRDDYLSGKSGAKVVAVRVSGEWRPVYVGCFPGNEIQKLAASGTVSGGTYILSFDGEDTDPIDHNFTAAFIEDQLELLPTIGAGNVTATGGTLPGSYVLIEFKGALANENVAKLLVKSSLTGGGTYVITTHKQGCCD